MDAARLVQFLDRGVSHDDASAKKLAERATRCMDLLCAPQTWTAQESRGAPAAGSEVIACRVLEAPTSWRPETTVAVFHQKDDKDRARLPRVFEEAAGNVGRVSDGGRRLASGHSISPEELLWPGTIDISGRLRTTRGEGRVPIKGFVELNSALSFENRSNEAPPYCVPFPRSI